MRANEKVAVAIGEDLKDWQKLNVVAFLASAIAIQFPDTHGSSSSHGSSAVSVSSRVFRPYRIAVQPALKQRHEPARRHRKVGRQAERARVDQCLAASLQASRGARAGMVDED